MSTTPERALQQLAAVTSLPSPNELRGALPLGHDASAWVAHARHEIAAVLRGDDARVLAIVGPCSIHDPEAALEYAQRLLPVRDRLRGRLLICMRVYLEKPRSSLGWKGLINDPDLNGECDTRRGLQLARRLLVQLAQLGLPLATETLDPLTPRYLADCVAWTAIGARTTESQTHREAASGLPMPVGFKNTTSGDLDPAICAIQAARAPHSFIGIDDDGRAGVVRSAGNANAHLVLRGGRGKPNYARADIEAAGAALLRAGLPARLVIDCSHDNSAKDPRKQPTVIAELASQLRGGAREIAGVMLESHLIEGRQEACAGQPLRYGQSITDGCLGIEATVDALEQLAAAVPYAQRWS